MERGLKHYLRQKAAAMRGAAESRPSGDAWREEISATCVADDASGVRKLRIRDWQFISDSGPAFGGWSLGPSSPELLCGVISTCLTHTYEIGAATLGIPLDRVEVRVSARNNDAGFLGLESTDPVLPHKMRANVRLESADATQEQIATLHRFAAERCPLTQLIRTPNELTIVVES